MIPGVLPDQLPGAQPQPDPAEPRRRRRRRRRNRQDNNPGGGGNRRRRGRAMSPYKQTLRLANRLLAPSRRDLENQIEAQQSLSRALAGIYAGVAPATTGAYQNAAEFTLGAGEGFSEDLQGTLEAQNADLEGFLAEIQAGGFDPANAEAAGDALLGSAYIPATGLAREGAAFGSAAARMPGTAAAMGELQAAQLRRQGLQDLAQRRAELIPQLMQLDIQQQAQDLYERQFGEERRQNRREYRLAVAGLQLESRQAAADAREAIREGRNPDSSLSRLLGYLVDQSGRPILDRNGNRIKVSEGASGGDRREAYRKAVGEAKDLRGDPISAPTGARGKYIARAGAAGVFPAQPPLFPATTNDPRKAKYDSEYSFHEALRFLVNHYGIRRKAARRALIAAGWPPPSGGGGNIPPNLPE